ncbi:Aste57867_811 [Aphanomyces stellatus]|uniref:Aste57867_811 protein n=1 Tax=Aphanomyces stellatus TaxID=120398 RepID=A0A485K3J0_9STRA|nr:hypothetical protein As57867_000810 [Aphanomyces stellatus]VFT78035.1 Aste57867_811 [Aphanomyces stellatus]
MPPYRTTKGTKFHVIGVQARVLPGTMPPFRDVWARVKPHVEGRQAYSFCFDFDDGAFTYMAAIEAAEGSALPEADWKTLTVPEHEFAVFDHTGSIETIGASWEAIMSMEDLKKDETLPTFEKYDAAMTCESGVTIWIPLQAAT